MSVDIQTTNKILAAHSSDKKDLYHMNQWDLSQEYKFGLTGEKHMIIPTRHKKCIWQNPMFFH
jgi:hypothetical protein